jgi:hypothetical protein
MNQRARSLTTNALAATRWPRGANPLPGASLGPGALHSSRPQTLIEPAQTVSAVALFSRHCAQRGWRALRPLQDDPQFNERFVTLVQSSSYHFEGFVSIALAPGDLRMGQRSMDDARPMRLLLGSLLPASMLTTSSRGASELDVERTRVLLRAVAFAEMIRGVIAAHFPLGLPRHTDRPDPVDVKDAELDRLFEVAQAAWADGKDLMPAARTEYTAERLHEACRNLRRPGKRPKPSLS